MKRNTFYISFLLCVISFVRLSAQQREMDSITSRFKDYRNASLQEKLFAHIDQEFYLTGEILWFRIYSVDGNFHKVSTTSKVAFIEVLDKNNSPLVQSKVALDENGGQGSLFLPATIPSGNYLVRVYTQWMRNYPSEYFFQKQITVVNPFVRLETAVGPKVAPKTLVEFFPEGGTMIDGIRTRVGFKLSRTDATKVDGKGAVIRNNSDTVAILGPHKFGLGSFMITPTLGDHYKCVFESSAGNVSEHALPKVSPEGFSMQVSDSSTTLLRVVVRHRGGESSRKNVFLFVHTRQSIVAAEMKPMYSSTAIFTIEKNKLLDGISHFTVFDQQRPVCERLYFKAPSPMAIDISSGQTSFSTRRKVSLNVSTTRSGKGIPADLSLAVYRIDSLSMRSREDILSYLYLQSDLAGRIESPAYYFSNEPGVPEAADNLMLTHGWRRFKWDNVLQKKNDLPFIPEVRSHLITGKVSKADGSPVPGVLTYLSSPGKIVNIYGARSNRDGLVHFEVRDFWGSRQLIFQTNTTQDSSYVLSLNNPYDESRASYTLSPFEISGTSIDRLSSRSLSMQIQDIYFRDVYDRIKAQKNDSTAFFGEADETYNLDDYTRFTVMEEVMREYVAGVLVRKRRDGFHFLVLDKVNKSILSEDPLVILDGMPVFDVDQIIAFDPLKIKKVEVVTRNYYLGPLLLPGIVSYSTYQGDLAGFSLDPRSISINYEGLQLQREFYSPMYETQKQRNHRLPDRRTLLHWQPVCRTDAAGKKTLEFYTSDTTGEYLVVANGLSANGVAGSGTYKFTVTRTDF